MIRKYYEIECDYCGSCEHFEMGQNIKEQARSTGWIISKYGHYCDHGCWYLGREKELDKESYPKSN